MQRLEKFGQPAPFRMPRQYRPPFPVQPKYIRWPLECTPHKSDPPILQQMRGRLITAAGKIQIRYGIGRENAESITPFWRTVDMAIGRERRRGNEEHPLMRNKRSMRGLDGLGEFCHRHKV